MVCGMYRSWDLSFIRYLPRSLSSECIALLVEATGKLLTRSNGLSSTSVANFWGFIEGKKTDDDLKEALGNWVDVSRDGFLMVRLCFRGN